MKMIAFTTLLLAGVAPLAAQSLSDRYAAEIDTNRDGLISRAEYIAMSKDHFARQDLDKDGQLSGKERPRYISGTEAITQEAYLKTSLSVFDGEDTDKNGTIGGDELKRFWDHLNRGQPQTSAPAQ